METVTREEIRQRISRFQAAMMIEAVGFSPLGLPWGAFSRPAAVDWNSAYIVTA